MFDTTGPPGMIIHLMTHLSLICTSLYKVTIKTGACVLSSLASKQDI